jgi:RNA polymerase sigma-70 factor (ECF subfamily)
VTDAVSFSELVQRVRAGDQNAAAELVRQYEPAVRRAVRMRLTDPRLRRTLDSVDVCQSVLANFFVRVAAGQFDLDKPGQLLNLLMTMAYNKVLDHVRHEQADRRDQRRVQGGEVALEGVAALDGTPSRIVAGKELLESVRAGLAEDERYLMDQRNLGRSWAELAAEAGTTPDALRVKLTRALDRVAQNLGLDDTRHD